MPPTATRSRSSYSPKRCTGERSCHEVRWAAGSGRARIDPISSTRSFEKPTKGELYSARVATRTETGAARPTSIVYEKGQPQELGVKREEIVVISGPDEGAK